MQIQMAEADEHSCDSSVVLVAQTSFKLENSAFGGTFIKMLSSLDCTFSDVMNNYIVL